MSLSRICLALLNADETCQREVARRLFGEMRILNLAQARSANHLEGVDVVAMLGDDVDLEALQYCLNSGRKVLLSGAACRGEHVERLLSQQLATTSDLLTIGNPIASLPSRQLIQQQTEHGKLGEPGLIRVHRWESTTEPLNEESQKLPLLLQYELDQALRYFSQLPQRVYATHHVNNRGMMIHLAWASGAMALIDFINKLSTQNSYASFSVIGSRGAAYADDHQNVQLLIQEQTHGRVAAEVTSPTAHMVTSFLASLPEPQGSSNGVPAYSMAIRSQPHFTLRSWCRSLLVARAVRQSMAQGTSIQLSDDL